MARDARDLDVLAGDALFELMRAGRGTRVNRRIVAERDARVGLLDIEMAGGGRMMGRATRLTCCGRRSGGHRWRCLGSAFGRDRRRRADGRRSLILRPCRIEAHERGDQYGYAERSITMASHSHPTSPPSCADAQPAPHTVQRVTSHGLL